MNFEYTTEQKEMKEQALKFARNEMWPITQEADKAAKLPIDICRKAHEMGLVNTCIPEEFGGTGLSTVDSIILCEALAYGCMGICTSLMANDLALIPIVIAGTEEQKQKFLTPYTDTESFKLASFCLTEPGHGSDAGGIKTQIKETKDGLEVTGEKMWITNAGQAELFVLYGTVDPKLAHKGITAVIIDPKSKGVEIGKSEKKMGHRCSDTRGIRFNQVKVPKENLLGEMGGGWKIAMKTLDHSRPLVAALAVGGAQCALDHAVKYSQERHQFGVPLASHQAIQLMIANMAMKVEASRLLTTKAAWLLDQGIPSTKLASYAKAYAADSGMEVATDAVQIFGGYGYSEEYPVEKIMRDAKLVQIYEGTSQIQRLVIAREIFKGK